MSWFTVRYIGITMVTTRKVFSWVVLSFGNWYQEPGNIKAGLSATFCMWRLVVTVVLREAVKAVMVTVPCMLAGGLLTNICVGCYEGPALMQIWQSPGSSPFLTGTCVIGHCITFIVGACFVDRTWCSENNFFYFVFCFLGIHTWPTWRINQKDI